MVRPEEEEFEFPLINCYNKTQLEEDYTLDNNIFKKCFETCQNCIEIGNETMISGQHFVYQFEHLESINHFIMYPELLELLFLISPRVCFSARGG